DAVGNPNNGGARTPDQWFNTNMFAMPALYTYGSSGAFTVEGDSRFTFDFSAGKRLYPHGDRHWIEFRGEFYNATNTVRLGDPTMTFTSSSFGKITTAVPARQVQLALRYSFYGTLARPSRQPARPKLAPVGRSGNLFGVPAIPSLWQEQGSRRLDAIRAVLGSR